MHFMSVDTFHVPFAQVHHPMPSFGSNRALESVYVSLQARHPQVRPRQKDPGPFFERVL